MLFAVRDQTPFCEVFDVLNKEFLFFLEHCIDADEFSDQLFSRYPCDGVDRVCECWLNEKTRRKFQELYETLPASRRERQALFDSIHGAQDISNLFQDIGAVIPNLQPDSLFGALKSLTSHMFTSTRDLADIKRQAGASVESHYQRFVRANGRSELCRICGTHAMSQNRENLGDDEQWRADYDHLLCKDKYPIFSVHPGNFFPTCHICNSKAKGRKKLLHSVAGGRRAALYPLPPMRESCGDYAHVSPSFRDRDEVLSGMWDDPLASVDITFNAPDQGFMDKIDVWKEVYEVPERVASHVKNSFYDRLIADLTPLDFPDFLAQLHRKVDHPPPDEQKSEWRFWWQRLYESLSGLPQAELEDIWELVSWRQQSASEGDADEVFA